jgi:UDP-perosamine 4-acetyltransferase
MKLLIVGAGGHARSVLDIASQVGEYSQISCIDSSYPSVRLVPGFEDVPIIGTDSDMELLFKQGYRHVFVALGDNKIRNKLFYSAVSLGYEPVNIISRSAIISPRAKLGKGICVMAGAVINVNADVGDNCIINTRCSIDHDCYISESCHIAPGVTLSGNVRINQGTWVGTGASVKDGITIGSWSYIGAGSVVVTNLESNALYYGVPAKRRKQNG